MNYNEIGRRIREKRLFLGYTQEQLAELSNIEPSYLSNLENGNRKMSIEVLVRIAKALESSVDYLLFGEHKIEKIKREAQFLEVKSIIENIDSKFLEEYIAYIKTLAITMSEVKINEKRESKK